MNVNTEILTILQDAKLQIQANLQNEKINASGRTSRSFAVRQNGTRFQLIMQAGDVAPAKTLETGLEPNVATWGIFGKIKNWIVDKKLKVKNVPYKTNREHKYTQDERNLQIATGAITHKIITKGTNRFSSPVEVIYSPVIDDVKKKVTNLMKNALILTIKDNK